jgi:putative ABC transport system substrate-binding protein
MQRRSLIAILGCLAAWPLSAHAQQSTKLPIIGYLGANSAPAQKEWTDAFVGRLRELGWMEGRNVAIEYRWAEGRGERYAEIAAEFVRLNVSVIVSAGNEASRAAQRATSTIPIVFPVAGDPVGTGLVASLARPGGNVTGVSIQQTDLVSKRLELMRELVPGLKRAGLLGNANSPNTVTELREVQAMAATLGIELITPEVRRAEDFAPAFEQFKGRADAVYVSGDPLVNTNRTRINELALAARMPTVFGFRELAEAGGLVSYGPNFPDLFRYAAGTVDKILRGAKPGDIPVEQPTKFELVINLKTAKTLGLKVPDKLLFTADQVIE